MSMHRFSLASGRRIAWTEYGACDGTPVLYCHGFPASGVEAAFSDSAARERGVRIVAPDRPGYGESDPLPGRSLLDWVSDATALLDHLGISQAPVIGVSGGGPYSLACAARHPQRFPRVATFGALGPLAAPASEAEMTAFNRGCIRLARGRYWRLQALLFHLTAGLIRLSPSNIFRLIAAGESAADRELFRDRALRAIWTESMRRSVLQGANAAIEELRLYVADWGFRLREVGVEVQLWHGLDDAVVPASHCAHIGARLPNCEPRLLPGEGHFTTPVRYVGAGLAWLRAGE